MSQTIEKLKSDINDFANLQENWNGYDAKKVFPLAISSAILFVDSNMFDLENTAIQVFPTGAGSVQLDISEKYWFAEIEFFCLNGENSVFFLLENKNDNEKDMTIIHLPIVDFMEVVACVSMFGEKITLLGFAILLSYVKSTKEKKQ